MFSNVIAICKLELSEMVCCAFDDCPMLEKCYPDAFSDWQKELAEEPFKEGYKK